MCGYDEDEVVFSLKNSSDSRGRSGRGLGLKRADTIEVSEVRNDNVFQDAFFFDLDMDTVRMMCDMCDV